MAIPLVLDVDTGVDDACALLLAALHPDVDLRAVTCVAGNAPVDDVVRNTRIVLDAAGRLDVPVGRGAPRPLLEPGRPARHVHGEDGMGDLGLPAPVPAAGAAEAAGGPGAVELLRDVLLAAADAGERITLVPLAPLTNVALLLRMHPEVARGLERIVFMGGAALVGNATAAAEFNVFHDPEAAAIVLDAAAELAVPITMYGLDVFYDVRVDRASAERLAAAEHAAARLAGRLVLFQCDRFGGDDATLGDAGALCAVLDPQGLGTRRLPVRVELTGAWTRGQTVVDRRPWTGDHAHDPHGIAPTLVDVALTVDGPRYADLWLETVSGRA